MKEACLNARASIDFEQYIFEDDAIGKEFVEVFLKKQKEGVKVRILCDMVGSFSFWSSPLPQRLRAAGAEMRFFHIVKPWRMGKILSWFFRDHRKVLVVDNTIGFVGGVCFRDQMRDWRDTHLKIFGPVVSEMREAFEELWQAAAEKNIFRRLKKGRKFVRGFYFITNSPYFRKRFLYREHLSAIRSAKRFIYFTTPYFVPDHRISRALRAAAGRGVEVKILLPAVSDIPWADRASRALWGRFLSAGVQLFRYHGDVLHAKTAVIDNSWSTVGSFNLDNMSILFNYEANIVSTEVRFAEEAKKIFLNDLARSQPVVLSEWLKRPLRQKMLEWLILPFRKFL